jgi:tetraacyldisaccharide 4'-kinase
LKTKRQKTMINKAKKYFLSLAMDRKNDIFSSCLKVCLLLLSFIYYLAVKTSVFLYHHRIFKKFKADSKVISVGNITLGGTGKTPVESFLIKYLFGNRKVCLIARGYNDDELDLLQLNFPRIKILAAKNRVKLIRKAQALFNPDIIMLDDGFQQWCIKLDLNIVVIDASCPFGNGWLLPRGILREPVSHLIRADIFFINKVDLNPDNLFYLKEVLEKINPNSIIVESRYKPLFLYEPVKNKKIDAESLKDKNVVAFCGIGHPESFKHTVGALGANIVAFFTFLDHYQYREEDIERIISSADKKKAAFFITTEKDWMRLNRKLIDKITKNFNLYILKIEVEILSGKESLIGKVSNFFNS